MLEIIVNDIVVEVERKNIKNLRLGVYPPVGRVRISSPMYLHNEIIKLFVSSKLEWIKKQQTKFELQLKEPQHEYIAGENHYFQGQSYLLNVIYCNKNRVELRDGKFIDLYIKHSATRTKRRCIMKNWYRDQLYQTIPGYIDKWQAIIGVKVFEYGIKQMKTKWGSCNITKKRILLNLELAKKPLHCLEYVVVHELVHLLERKHNDKFNAYLNKFMPEWKVYRKELNGLALTNK